MFPTNDMWIAVLVLQHDLTRLAIDTSRTELIRGVACQNLRT